MTDTYTDDEIVDIYRRGKSDRRIMQKLCELSCKPRDEVLTILHAAGEALPETPDREKKAHGLRISDEVWRKIIADRLNGTGVAEICDTYHVCKTTIQSRWRTEAKRLGIPLPDHRISSGVQCIPDKIRKDVDEMEEKILVEKPKEVTACDILIDASYFLRPYPGANFKLEYTDGAVDMHALIPASDGAVELHAVIPVKEAAV